MKSIIWTLSLVFTASTTTNAFLFHQQQAAVRQSNRSSCLSMGGFLEGKGKKNEIMKREDEAMWVDEGDTGGGWNPFAKKAPAAKAPAPAAKKAPASAAKKAPALVNPFAKKAPVEKAVAAPPKKAASGFKFPWDK